MTTGDAYHDFQVFILFIFCFVLLARVPVPSAGRLPGSCLYASWYHRPWLVCFILFCLVSIGTYPRPSIWPSACSLVPGGWWCAHPRLYIRVVFYFFTSHGV